jgi:hypothetical protein
MQSIKPGRGQSFMGGIASLMAAGFGVIWTIMAFAITRDSPFPVVGWAFPLFGILFIISGLTSAAYQFFNATTKRRLSIIDITSQEEELDPLNAHFRESAEGAESTESRLRALEKLKASGVITEAEYSEQRQRIIHAI